MTWGLVAIGGLGLAGSIYSGNKQAEAAENAAQLQADAANNAANLTAQATEIQRQDLQPFTQFGQSFIPAAQQAANQSQQLFTDPTSIMSNPLLQAIQQQNQTDIMQNAAVRGRLGTGGTQQHLQDSALRTGFDFLNQERNMQLQNANFLQGLVGQGQSAAAGQGAATQFGNQVQTGFSTDAAAANAAGQIGVANAQSQTAQNLVGTGTTLINGLNFGTPTTGTGVAPDAVGFGGYGAGL